MAGRIKGPGSEEDFDLDVDLDEMAKVYIAIAKSQNAEVASAFMAEALAAEMFMAESVMGEEVLAAEASNLSSSFQQAVINLAESETGDVPPLTVARLPIAAVLRDFLQVAEATGD